MRFKSYNNRNYTLEVNDDATVWDVAKKLAEEIDKFWADIVLIFENRICFPHELIKKYKIGEDDYVLFDWSEEYREFNRNYLCGKFGLDRDSFDLTEEFLRNEKRKKYVERYRSHLKEIGGRLITVMIKDTINPYGRTYEINTTSNETIRNLKYHLWDKMEMVRNMNDSWTFTFGGLMLSKNDDDRTLESCGIDDRENILLIQQLSGCCNSCIINDDPKYSIDVIPINSNRESFTLGYPIIPELPKFISDVSNRINEPPSIIELFSQPHSTSHYKIDNLNSLETFDPQNINIYYDIIPDTIVSLVSINIKGQSFEVRCGEYISRIIKLLSSKIEISESFVELYYDKNKTNRIKEERISDLTQITSDSPNRIIIYYYIREIIENFIQNKLLGEGAFGTVYKYTEIGSNKVYAVKMFQITEQKKESFNKELSVIKELDHPKIVRYERQIKTDNYLYLLMEYVPGGSLGSYVRSKYVLPEREIAKYSKQILEGLQYLHNEKIIHRDIKGDNILLDNNGNIKLCDFGLAKRLTKFAKLDLLNGAVKSAVGTANWMAPEIICGDCYGFSVDIWSFGATLVEMVTGRIPYCYHGIAARVIFLIGTKKQIDFTYPEGVTENLKEFINLCLQGDPSKRATINDLMKHQFLV